LFTLTLTVAGVAILLAGFAVFRTRSAARRAERLAESYWELRYEIGQLKVRINRLESAAGLGAAEPEATAAAPQALPATSFVPLSSLKK
jgi:hypothetical protein